MAYSFRIWDKKSPINGCEADKAAASLGVGAADQLCILTNDDTKHDEVVQKFPITASDADIKAWVDSFNATVMANQKGAAEAAAKPTLEQRVAANEAALLTLMGGAG